MIIILQELKKIIEEHDAAIEEVVHIPTVDNASCILQRFVAMARTDQQHIAEDIMTPSGYSSSVPSNDKVRVTSKSN